jgi:hypothetical protein
MNDLFMKLISLKGKGYCCAQILLILALEAQGKTDADLVRSFAGLCFGVNWSGEVCGALSGGTCLISLYAGKGSDIEAPDDKHQTMMNELIEWFRATADEYGGTRCSEILGRFPDRSICGQIVIETYEKCMEILEAHGFDPKIGRRP